MAKKKAELFINIQHEKEFHQIIRQNADLLICAEVYSRVFGSCTALDRLFNTLKLVWSDGNIILLKVPADDSESLIRFRNQSEPVYLFILNMKVTKVFRGVDAVRFAEVAKNELEYYKQSLHGSIVSRQMYNLDEPTPDEIEWIESRALEKQREKSSLIARKLSRQAARKKHRAELMVPYLKDLNFVIFFPHCIRAHPELYERWDINNIIMVGREEFQITEDNLADVFYEGDVPLNEASIQKILSGKSLAICFRAMDNVNFVALVRRILYEDLRKHDDRKSMENQLPMKTAYDFYKTISPTREEVWKHRREERERNRESRKRERKRLLSEMQRLARQAIQDTLEARRLEKEKRKLDLLKAGDLVMLDKLKQEPDNEETDIVIPEVLTDEADNEEIEEVEDENEYFPPPGLTIPGFYAPANDIAKANGLAFLFPKIIADKVTPQPEFLPPHLLVMLDISKRYKALDAISPYKRAILNMGIFKAISPYHSAHIAYSVKQFDILDTTSLNLDKIKLAFMISMEVDVPLLHLMDVNPCHVSRDLAAGEEECAAMFPVHYADDYDQFEDFGSKK